MDRLQLEALSNITLLRLISDATAVLLERATPRPAIQSMTYSTTYVHSSSEDSVSQMITESWAVVVCRLLNIPIYREDPTTDWSEDDIY